MHVPIVFVLTTLLTVFLFYIASNRSRMFLILTAVWMLLQAVIAFNGFYQNTVSFPPRLIFLAPPTLIVIALLFVTQKGKKFLDRLNPEMLTILHIIRVPVELVLYWLFLQGSVPELMTFEGRNFDILSGFSAPFVYYFGYIKKQMSKPVVVIWNFVCLGLLGNIVSNAVLSTPYPFQQLAFDMPNTAILNFPYVWLPCIVVPIVLLAHLASLRHLFKKNTHITSVPF